MDEGIDLAIKALNSAMRRDAASGDGMEIVVITKKGWTVVDEKEIEKRKKNLNIK